MKKSFLGVGWNFPVSFNEGGKEVLMAREVIDIEQSLAILITTARGERIMHPSFGTSLRKFLYEEVTLGMISNMKDIITSAISLYETRITLINIDINQDQSEIGKLLINLEYLINETNTRTNKVYPFYLQEATLKVINYE